MDSLRAVRRWGQRLAAGLAMALGGMSALAVTWLWRPSTTPSLACHAAPVSAERLREHVRTLSETLHPRDYLSVEGLERTADLLSERFTTAGGRVRSEPYTVKGRSYRNVIASFGPEAGERLVIGAHYDAFQGTPGADDNASGVAALLELATYLGEHPPPMRVDLVGFTLEEPPWFRTSLMGSAVHARALREAGVQVRAMISLESIGYYSDEPGSQQYPLPALRFRYPTTGHFIAVVGQFADDGLVRKVAGAMRAGSNVPVEFLSAPSRLRGVDFSDHANFWRQGYPAVMLTDTAFYRNSRYHTARDSWDTLDYDRMAEVVQGVQCAVQVLTAPQQ